MLYFISNSIHVKSCHSNYSKVSDFETTEISVNTTLKILIYLDRKSAKNSRVKENDGSAKPPSHVSISSRNDTLGYYFSA